MCITVAKLCRCCSCGARIFVRTFHTLLCIGVPATLMVKNSDLNLALVHQQNLPYGIAYFSLLIFSLVMYWTTCLIDPGFVPLPKKGSFNNNNSDDDDEDDEDDEDGSSENCTMIKTSGGGMKQRKCGFCGIYQPMRTRHCEDCGRCVRKFDHHCPWLESCVGERNHKFFWLFLVSITGVILWSLVLAWRAIVYKATWDQWVPENVFFIVDVVILVLGGMTTVALLGFHSYLMVFNLTTWETVSRNRITYLKYLEEEYNPFHEGYCSNMKNFLCAVGIRKWEGLYIKKADIEAGVV